MRPVAAMLALLLGAGIAFAGERETRERAAADLRCPARKVKIDLFIDEGVEKIDARGCGRAAEYLNAPEGPVLTLLELEPTPAMSVRVARELECPADAVAITRTWVPATRASELKAWGCGREASYDVEGEVLNLTLLSMPAPPDVVQKVSADLGCPAGALVVKQTRTGKGALGASTHGCQDNAIYEYTLAPFERVVQPPSKGMTDVMRRAAADFPCPPEQLSVKWEGKQTKDQDPVRATITGCGRTVIYERKAYGYVPSVKRETP